MEKIQKIFIAILILVLLVIVIFVFWMGVKTQPNSELIKVLTDSNCRLLPGTPQLPGQTVRSDDEDFSTVKDQCETAPTCEMHSLGVEAGAGDNGEDINVYTCCPKDLYTGDSVNPKYQTIIDNDPTNLISDCVLSIN